MNFNQVILIGRLTTDPELKILDETRQVVKFPLAVNRSIKDKDGNNIVDYFNIIAWNKTAQFIADYIKKGNLIMVTGSIHNNQWIDSDNVKRVNTEIVAKTVISLEKKPQQTQQKEDLDYI